MIQALKIDADIEERLKEFNAKLPPDQKVVSMVPSSDYLFVRVEKKEPVKTRLTLLNDQLKRGPHRT